MLRELEYAYYRIYQFAAYYNELTPGAYAGSIIISCLTCNIYVIILCIGNFVYFNITLNTLTFYFFLCVIGLIAINYFSKNYATYCQRWDKEDGDERQRKGMSVLMYVLVSLISPFVLALYIHAHGPFKGDIQFKGWCWFHVS